MHASRCPSRPKRLPKRGPPLHTRRSPVALHGASSAVDAHVPQKPLPKRAQADKDSKSA